MAYHKHANTRVTLPSDATYWVELRRLSLLDAQAINRDYLGGIRLAVGNVAPEIAVRDMDGEAAILAILRAVVRSWNLDDEAGAILPITDAALKDLDPDDLEFIVHRAVEGTALAATFGTASIKVAEAPDTSTPTPEPDNLFTAGLSQP